MKILVNIMTLIVFIFGMIYGIPRDRNVLVSNHIVPMNSNWASQVSATIAFSTDPESVSQGSSAQLAVHEDSYGIIIVSAPFCGQYLSSSCSFPIPEYCLRHIQTSGKLFISGVISEFGLDYYSFRCVFTADIDA